MDNPFEAIRTTLLERGWTKHKYEDWDGSLCLVGAVRAQYPAYSQKPWSWAWAANGDPVMDRLKEHTGYHAVSDWNDERDRTFSDVMELLDECSRDWKLEHDLR